MKEKSQLIIFQIEIKRSNKDALKDQQYAIHEGQPLKKPLLLAKTDNGHISCLNMHIYTSKHKQMLWRSHFLHIF